jgi:hypothetical protein
MQFDNCSKYLPFVNLSEQLIGRMLFLQKEILFDIVYKCANTGGMVLS